MLGFPLAFHTPSPLVFSPRVFSLPSPLYSSPFCLLLSPPSLWTSVITNDQDVKNRSDLRRPTVLSALAAKTSAERRSVHPWATKWKEGRGQGVHPHWYLLVLPPLQCLVSAIDLVLRGRRAWQSSALFAVHCSGHSLCASERNLCQRPEACSCKSEAFSPKTTISEFPFSWPCLFKKYQSDTCAQLKSKRVSLVMKNGTLSSSLFWSLQP